MRVRQTLLERWSHKRHRRVSDDDTQKKCPKKPSSPHLHSSWKLFSWRSFFFSKLERFPPNIHFTCWLSTADEVVEKWASARYIPSSKRKKGPAGLSGWDEIAPSSVFDFPDWFVDRSLDGDNAPGDGRDFLLGQGLFTGSHAKPESRRNSSLLFRHQLCD